MENINNNRSTFNAQPVPSILNAQPIPLEPIYSTRDLYLATTLVTLKFMMIGIDYLVEGSKNRPIGYFKFENSPMLQDAKNKYGQSLLVVEPKTFITNLNSLKAEVIGAFSNPHARQLDGNK
jgi:hypothetical protein